MPSSSTPEPRPNRYSRWRAGTLALVYVLMGLHIAHWKITGRTLAPLELNEVMVTLELGIVTAGFLFMVVAFVSAGIFGRFFCSWGCHILALEDLCAWLLGKVGIRPKPIRSRMLLIVPPAALLYMFVWPQVARLVEGGSLPRLSLAGESEQWASFVTNDFWRNLPPVGVALFTFAVCGFLIVYVLGTRSFCRHACPYGAAFALADRVAPGRLVHVGKCEGCGQCTAACQSGINVHQELAAFGTVMDSGCLKDLDCISACPSGAIGFRFTKPSLFRSRPSLFRSKRVEGAPKRKYDFSLAEELGMGVVFLIALLVFRGLYGLVPFLLALAIAAIFSYLAVLALRMRRRETVKMGRMKLKVQGNRTRSGRAFAAIAPLLLLLLLHSAFVRTNEWLGRRAYEQLDPASPAIALEAIDRLERVERWGLTNTPVVDQLLAALYLASEEPGRAVVHLQRLLEHGPENHHSRLRLARALFGDGRPVEAEAQVEQVLAAEEDSPEAQAEAYSLLGHFRANSGEPEGAITAYQSALLVAPENAAAHRALGELFSDLRRFERAVEHFSAALVRDPDSAPTQYNLAVLLAQLGRDGEAIERYRIAARLAPDDPETWNNLGFLLAKHSQLTEAEACFRRAILIDGSFAHSHFNLGRLLLMQGRQAEAEPELRSAAALDSRYAEVLAK